MKKEEQQEQIKLVQWMNIKKILHYSIPNGGSRNRLEAINLKREGLVSGVPDICIPIANKHFHGLYIEMKRKPKKLKSGKLSYAGIITSENQKKWIKDLRDNGYEAIVCYGFNEAKKTIECYLN